MPQPDHPDTAPVPLPAREGKRATHDGYLWPFTRAEMRDAICIIARMADDCRAVMRHDGSGPTIHKQDLRNLGWATLQIDLHFARALDMLHASSGHIAARRTPALHTGPDALPLAEAGSAA